MGNARDVVKVIRPVTVLEGAGVKLKRSFPHGEIDFIDPFLLLDDFSSDNPDDFVRGFPWHPHRGIETVSYILEGIVNHGDTLGNRGTIQAGGVQWMTAGSGIMHEEMPDPKSGGLTAFQLWVNLPASGKMTVPRYQNISSERIPVVHPGNGVAVRVIAGSVDGISGPVKDIAIKPLYIDIELSAGTTYNHPVPKDQAAMAYLFEGKAVFGSSETKAEEEIIAPSLVIFGDGNNIEMQASSNGGRCLLMSGTPLNEPVARYGPFVMNTTEEIQQAIRELKAGTFIRNKPEDKPS